MVIGLEKMKHLHSFYLIHRIINITRTSLLDTTKNKQYNNQCEWNISTATQYFATNSHSSIIQKYFSFLKETFFSIHQNKKQKDINSELLRSNIELMTHLLCKCSVWNCVQVGFRKKQVQYQQVHLQTPAYNYILE